MASINLNDKGISSSDARFREFSKHIQGNILKGHGRGHTSHIFFTIKDGMEDATRAFIQGFAHSDITTAYQQEVDKRHTKIDGIQRFFIGLYLSATGYSKLLKDTVPISISSSSPEHISFPDSPFIKGMKDVDNLQLISDPVPNEWQEEYTADIDGMVIIAMGDKNRDRLDAKARQVIASMEALANVFKEEGNSFKNSNGDDIEHFGYVDGISQPRFFFEDFSANSNIDTNISAWNPLMHLGLVLAKDPFSNHPDAFGSYFVFRKLEQNVKAFREAEMELGDQLETEKTRNMVIDSTKLAGALLIGRHKNGMPVTISQFEDNVNGWPIQRAGSINNFNYSTDPGSRCPFHAHIRKTNPRRDSNARFGVTLETEMEHMMARRGIIYGKRTAHPNDEKVNIDDLPKDGVGLLFMSFQANLENQFIFIQKSWANNHEFVNNNTGNDPIIGQGDIKWAKHKYATDYGDESFIQAFPALGNFVTMKGGEYFFAPSMDFLQNIQEIHKSLHGSQKLAIATDGVPNRTVRRPVSKRNGNGTAPRKKTPALAQNGDNRTEY